MNASDRGGTIITTTTTTTTIIIIIIIIYVLCIKLPKCSSSENSNYKGIRLYLRS